MGGKTFALVFLFLIVLLCQSSIYDVDKNVKKLLMFSFLVPFEEIKTQNEVRQYDFAYVNLLY